jgi:hypothetical protein
MRSPLLQYFGRILQIHRRFPGAIRITPTLPFDQIFYGSLLHSFSFNALHFPLFFIVNNYRKRMYICSLTVISPEVVNRYNVVDPRPRWQF